MQISKVFYALTVLAALYAALELFTGLAAAESAVQQGAVAAMSAAYVVIPYCLARAIEALECNTTDLRDSLATIIKNTYATAEHLTRPSNSTPPVGVPPTASLIRPTPQTAKADEKIEWGD